MDLIKSFKDALINKENDFSLYRLTLIGSTLFLGKIVLIFAAYFFTETEYNTFNKAYYTASIIIIFGTLGFEFAVTRLNIKPARLFVFVCANSLAAFLVLLLISQPLLTTAQFAAIYFYAVFAILGGIYTFKLLFNGEYKKYFNIMLMNALLHLAIIPAVKIFNTDIYFTLPFISLLWFSGGVLLFQFDKMNSSGVFEFYKTGASVFIINASVPFALAADKYIVNNFFMIETANAYTFSWALTAPLFYIGNLVEKTIYSSAGPDSQKIFGKAVLLLLVMILGYAAVILSVIFFFSSLLPQNLDINLVKNIFIFMITGYSVYVLFHFPLNGYLFKFLNVDIQKLIAKYYAFSITLLIVAFVVFIGLFGIADYRFLLLMVWIFIFLLLYLKWRLIYIRLFPNAKKA